MVIYLLPGVAFSVVAAVALPLLLPQPKPSPEADKSPGSPKLAIKSYLLRELFALSGSLRTAGQQDAEQDCRLMKTPSS